MSTTLQINEEKNYPTEKIKERSRKIKEGLKSIESSQIERDSRKPGMPSSLSKEVATKIIGPIDSLKKKLKESIDDKKPTDDIRSNLAQKRMLDQIEKELEVLKKNAAMVTKKVASELSKLEPKSLRAQSAQRKAKEKYETGEKKKKSERDFMANKYTAENFDFKQRTRQHLGLNEMAMKHFGPDAEKKYSKDELKDLFNKTAVSSLASSYVKNARADGMEDKKIAQGLGATLRGMEDKDKVAEVKKAVKEKLELAGDKKKKEEDKKEDKKSSKPSFLGK